MRTVLEPALQEEFNIEENNKIIPELIVNKEKLSQKEGFSNTPPTSYQFNTCIDYLKFRFNLTFDENSEEIIGLKERLYIKDINGVEGQGFNGYTNRKEYGVGLSIMYGGRITKTKEGKNTILLEMKGSACRDFEERSLIDAVYINGEIIDREEMNRKSWIELIDYCLKIGGICTRIDIPVDDFSGNITINEIKDKIKNREYVTKMRHLEITDSGDDEIKIEKFDDEIRDSLIGIPTIIDSKLSGYCAIFGGRKTTQLCIYDKKAEQKVKGFQLSVDHWIRYETRYYHQNAEQEIERLLLALKEKNESKHIAGCLAANIEFKEKNNYKNSNKYKASVWDKWKLFLQGVEKEKPFAKYSTAVSVDTNAIWLIKTVCKSIARVLAGKPVTRDELINISLKEAIKRLNNKDLLLINESRRLYRANEFLNLNDLKTYVNSFIDLDKPISSAAFEVFYGEKFGKRSSF